MQLTEPNTSRRTGSEPILRVDAVTKRYGARTVLDGFSIDLHAGEVHGLLGPNGSGKSTALHVISGLVPADGGTVTIQGVSVERKASRHHMGLAPDDLPLPSTLTGGEYLDFHAAMRRVDERSRRDRLVAAFGMAPALAYPVGEYSHGMKRKIQLIAATSHGPELVILDEPFRGLDPDAGAVLRELIQAVAASGRAVLIATHDMLRAQRDCDVVTILHAGRTVAQGTPSGLMTVADADSLESVFMRRTGLEAENGRRVDDVRAAFERTAPLDAAEKGHS